ncbi:MAG: hypothetical protein EBV83_09930, partial [Verrucomicrobia bacterium]|nr:hypothetical protein [Verrucomicrobiota bacterium]
MTGVAQGSATITYAISSCLTTTSATINAVPASITGVTSICLPTTSDLDNTANAGTWTSSNAAIATVNSSTGVVTSVAVGTANITYSNGCGSAAVSAVNVGTTPAAITGTTTFCSNDNTTLSNAVAGGTWSSSNTSIATISSGGVVTGLAEGASTISYTMVNGCGTNAATTTVNVELTGKWLGITSEWTDTDNWPCGTIPSASINVTIPSGTAYLPDFSGSIFEMKNLTVASGVSLTINSDATFNVKGNLINNGSILGDGTLNMVGTSAQTISGVGIVANVNINNSNGVSVNLTDTMKISKVFTMSAGTFNANGGLLLLSNETGSARIAQIAGGSITGNVGVQQFFTGGRRAYRFFGHPFSAAIPLSQLTTGIDITGNGGAANGFTTTGSNAASCFRYNTLLGNTSLSSDPGWKPFTGTSLAIDTNQFKQYQGIRLFIRGT